MDASPYFPARVLRNRVLMICITGSRRNRVVLSRPALVCTVKIQFRSVPRPPKCRCLLFCWQLILALNSPILLLLRRKCIGAIYCRDRGQPESPAASAPARFQNSLRTTARLAVNTAAIICSQLLHCLPTCVRRCLSTFSPLHRHEKMNPPIAVSAQNTLLFSMTPLIPPSTVCVDLPTPIARNRSRSWRRPGHNQVVPDHRLAIDACPVDGASSIPGIGRLGRLRRWGSACAVWPPTLPLQRLLTHV